MSQQMQLVAIARHLSSLIDQQITSSPGEPQLVISALKMLIPEAEGFFTQIEELPNEEEQWNHVIHFIETQVFDQGMEFGFEKLDTEEIIEVYKVVVEMVQQAIGDQDQQDQQENEMKGSEEQDDQQENYHNPRQHQINSLAQNDDQPDNRQQSNGSNQTASGEESSSNQHLKQVEVPSKNPVSNAKNQQSLNYIENVKKQQQQKKKQLESHQKSTQQKGNNKKQQQPKQANALKPKNKNQAKPQKDQPQEKQKITNAQKQNKVKSNSVLSKPQHQSSKHQQSSQQPHTKSAIRENTSNKNTHQINELNQKHNKSQNEPKQQKLKKQRPKTAVNKLNQQKSAIQPHEKDMKTKKSSINLNQKQKPQGQDARPKSCSRNKREMNIMNQPLEEVVVQTIQEVMKKKTVGQRELKSNPLMRDNYVTEMMQKAARTYKYEAKNHKTQQKHKQQQQQKLLKSSLASSQPPNKKDNYMKLLKQKQQSMQSQVLNSQLKYYYQLRDKKLAYIKHMHKLMEKLEKERNIELKKKQTELTRQEKQKIRKKIEQADNLFRDNMKGIKENYVKEREKNRVSAGEEIRVLSQMEKNLVKNKENQLNVMKCLWEQERLKLDLIAKDQEKIKHKLQHMYRKHKA